MVPHTNVSTKHLFKESISQTKDETIIFLENIFLSVLVANKIFWSYEFGHK